MTPEAAAIGYASANTVRVAIVDGGQHGNDVLATYLSQCGASCPDPNPILVSDTGPDGSLTEASEDNAIVQAVSQGANIVNLSGGNVNSNTPLTTDDLNALSYLSEHGAILVVAAGNSPGFVDTFSEPNPYRSNVVEVSGLNPGNSTEVDPRVTTDADFFANDQTPGDTDEGTSFSAPRVTAILAQDEGVTGTQNATQAIANVGDNPDVRTPVNLGSGNDGTVQQTTDSTASGDSGDVTVTADDGTVDNESVVDTTDTTDDTADYSGDASDDTVEIGDEGDDTGYIGGNTAEIDYTGGDVGEIGADVTFSTSFSGIVDTGNGGSSNSVVPGVFKISEGLPPL